MNRKKELQRQYKEETKIEGGVYAIVNNRNGRRLIASTPDLKSLNGRRFMLAMGSHTNRELQREWNEYGADSFEFEVLEKLERKENESIYYDMKDELVKLEQSWIDRLQPYGERGYHGNGGDAGKDAE
ncbi:GIY-YIG nuclease family protein [Cohnella faecalis]|uniref:GIY-YIG nuclease family protein n=1 Tax=Cohnella faecalis TaxID=2315694 RepID=A0A398CIP4_9BACL|nr:GIY-YIG nuclease family protein [Cohnella faecalis]RIE02250.1 GIY-YIG nuclease family protein [Cohnella faecalis]